MPLYDYQCPKCGTVREVQHPVSEIGKIQVMCQNCSSIMKKMISLPALIGFDEVGRSVAKKGQEESAKKESSTGQDASKGKETKAEAAKDTASKKESRKDTAA